MAIWTAAESVGELSGAGALGGGDDGAEDAVGVDGVVGADGVDGVVGAEGVFDVDGVVDAVGVAVDVADIPGMPAMLGPVALADGSAAGTMAWSWPSG